MCRSKWKGPFINLKDLNKTEVPHEKMGHYKTNPVMSRNSCIVPAFMGITCNVYNGKNFNEVTVNTYMIGHKFGEFSFTRAKFSFKKKKAKKK